MQDKCVYNPKKTLKKQNKECYIKGNNLKKPNNIKTNDIKTSDKINKLIKNILEIEKKIKNKK